MKPKCHFPIKAVSYPAAFNRVPIDGVSGPKPIRLSLPGINGSLNPTWCFAEYCPVMGMGEPLLNYKNVLGAIERITSPDGLGMSARRITVSTAGVAKMIKQLGDDRVRFKLALSLHGLSPSAFYSLRCTSIINYNPRPTRHPGGLQAGVRSPVMLGALALADA